MQIGGQYGVAQSTQDGSECYLNGIPVEFQAGYIAYVCNTTATTAFISSIVELSVCRYTAVVQTQVVCPQVPSTGFSTAVGTTIISTQCGGGVYDLSRINGADIAGFFGAYQWAVRPCGALATSGCSTGISICQTNYGNGAGYPLATYNPSYVPTFYQYGGPGIVSQIMQDGGVCFNAENRLTNVTYVCNVNASFPVLVSATESVLYPCHYLLVIQTSATCGQPFSGTTAAPIQSSSSSSPLSLPFVSSTLTAPGASLRSFTSSSSSLLSSSASSSVPSPTAPSILLPNSSSQCVQQGYNLTSLTGQDLFYTGAGYTWAIRPCGVVSSTGFCTQQPGEFCQGASTISSVNSTAYGVPSSDVLWGQVQIGGQYGVAQALQDGTECYLTSTTPIGFRAGYIAYVCNATATTAFISSIVEVSTCHYTAVVQTQVVCPQVPSTGFSTAVGTTIISTQCGGGVYDLSRINGADIAGFFRRLLPMGHSPMRCIDELHELWRRLYLSNQHCHRVLLYSGHVHSIHCADVLSVRGTRHSQSNHTGRPCLFQCRESTHQRHLRLQRHCNHSCPRQRHGECPLSLSLPLRHTDERHMWSAIRWDSHCTYPVELLLSHPVELLLSRPSLRLPCRALPRSPYQTLPARSASCPTLCPGSVDYPFSIAWSLQLTYSPTPLSTNMGSAVALLMGTGTRTYTNRFGASFSTSVTLSSSALLYLSSALPVDGVGLSFNLSLPVQLPGADPTVLYSQLQLFAGSGVVMESASALLDGFGQAFVSSVPGFTNQTVGAANINSLPSDYVNCRAPITFTNGLRPPTQPTISNGAVRFSYSYSISDGTTYSVQTNLSITTTSAFATSHDQLGNPYQTIVAVTGVRLYTHLLSGLSITSAVTIAAAVNSTNSPKADQRFHPYALLSAAPGVYTVNQAPFLDGDGLTFTVNPPVPANGLLYSTLYNTVTVFTQIDPTQDTAVLAESPTATNAPSLSFQRQAFTLL